MPGNDELHEHRQILGPGCCARTPAPPPPAKRLQNHWPCKRDLGQVKAHQEHRAGWQREKCSLCWGTGDNLLCPSLGREIGMLVLRAVERAKLLLKPTGTGGRWFCKTEPQTLKKGNGGKSSFSGSLSLWSDFTARRDALTQTWQKDSLRGC